MEKGGWHGQREKIGGFKSSPAFRQDAEFLIGAEDETLREFPETSKTGRAAKTLLKQGALRITLVALKKGTVFPPHQVTGPVSIQTIRGCLRVTTDKGGVDVTPGTLMALGPGVAHTAKAHDDCSILLTFAMP